jgi:hypothetical protein
LEKRHFTYVALAILVWAILGTTVAAYYFVQYNTYRSEYNALVDQLGTDVGDVSTALEGISLKANILLSYGNGTKIWNNGTVLPLGATAFTAIFSITDEINYTDYGEELGILVTSINRVTNNSTHGWFYWRWNPESSEWILPDYSCAKYILHRGETIAFTYADYMEWPPSTPT